MATWGEVLKELKATPTPKGSPDFDAVRRKYLAQLSILTGRETILYATDFRNPNANTSDTAITDSDIHGLMEVVKDLKGENLDLIIDSPGGSVTAAESFVHYLRTRFAHIRILIPHQAMSAATMIALSGDEIHMGSHSYLGPIDPQIFLPTPLGHRWIPAQTVIDQFESAREELLKDTSNFPSWAPILPQYGPDLLKQCENARELAEQLAKEWASKYLLAGQLDAEERGQKIAGYLSNHSNFLTHSRNLPREKLEEIGIPIQYLEADHNFQDAVLSVFHSAIHTFGGDCIKIIENHQGRGLFRLVRSAILPTQGQVPVSPPGIPTRRSLPKKSSPKKKGRKR